uniref:BTB domain-containing protein n=1 Tax=Meloidogyne javanica TaxID=6303 RepID=A0A915M006_MELJA
MNSMGRKYEDNEDRLRILKKSFIKMFEEETLADFVIKIDNETINTHRCVLAQNSEVFKRMLGQNMIEKEISCIKYIYANREEFLISKEWEEFKSLNGESAFKMLEDALLGKFVINGKFWFLIKKKNDTNVDFDSLASFGFGSGI